MGFNYLRTHQTLVYVLKHWFYSLADSLDPRCPDVLNPQNSNGENAVAAQRRITAHISMKKEKKQNNFSVTDPPSRAVHGVTAQSRRCFILNT